MNYKYHFEIEFKIGQVEHFYIKSPKELSPREIWTWVVNEHTDFWSCPQKISLISVEFGPD